MRQLHPYLLVIAASAGVWLPARADYLSGDDLKRAISGASIKAKTAKDGNIWEIRFGRTRDAEFKFADGTRRRAQWTVNGKRIEFVFVLNGDRTCRMIFLAPNGQQHWQDCETSETSSYLTHPTFAEPKEMLAPNLNDVTAALNVESDALRTRKFVTLGPAQVTALATKSNLRSKIKFDVKRIYAVVAACAADCSHVLLILRSPDGSKLIESPEQQPVVVVSGEADRSGEHEIEVSMPGCKMESCPVGFEVFRLER